MRKNTFESSSSHKTNINISKKSFAPLRFYNKGVLLADV